MSQTPPSFHLRMPGELKDRLKTAGESNGMSLNREIVERLERTFDPDPALQLADALRPILSALDDDDSREVVRLVVGLVNIFARAPKG